MRWLAGALPSIVVALSITLASSMAKAADVIVFAAASLKEALDKQRVTKVDEKLLRQQIKEGIKAERQVVPPGTSLPWQVDLGSAKNSLRGQPLYLRVKFNAADKSPSGTFGALWQVGIPKKTAFWQTQNPMSLAPDTFHEFEIPPDLFDENGLLTIIFANPNNVPLLFPIEDGIEVLYRESSFGLNFARGLGIIFCWMALLATLGLAMASSLSFPVAAFASLAALGMTFSTSTMASAVTDGSVLGYNSETGVQGQSPVDVVVLPVFKAALKVINLAKDFSPIDSLSAGRSITWNELGVAFGRIVLLLGGPLAVIGIWSFNRRELATAQNQS